MIRSVPLQAGGKTYNIRFSFNAIVSLEEKLGKGVDAITRDLTEDLSFKLLRTVMWAGLVDNHEGITEHVTGQIIDEAGIQNATEAMIKAINGMMPEASGNGVNPPAAVRASKLS